MLRGSLVALITPMHDDGSIDWAALERLVGWHLAEGTHGIVPVGTTGESATLNVDEHLQVIEKVVELVGGRVPVVAGTGANATAEAIHLTREAQGAGVDACLVVTPYYNKPTQEGLFRHYMAIAEATEVPLVLYNVPPRTACDMSAHTVGRLAVHPRIVAIKEACGRVERVSEIRQAVPEDFVILSGEDAQTLDMMKLGAVGTISVTANVLPALMAKFCEAFLAGNKSEAERLDAVLQPIHEILFVESSPQPTKWALYEMGRAERGIRLPLIELSEKHRPELVRRLRAAGAMA
ncbi:MAG: 4-hydroxy-tetrahydrodipicolinate synthase [Pseudomonadales bacterium]|nr:4-hydroxy-tetrahydrodipicolinate synthase [Pseudomonadales bacterium]